MPAMVFPRVALVRVHQTFGGCWYPSHIRHNETTAFTKNPPPGYMPGLSSESEMQTPVDSDLAPAGESGSVCVTRALLQG